MSLFRCFFAVACCACASLCVQRADAYHVTTDINYATATGTLSGYSETWKDPWEPNVDNYCGAYAWDDVYGPVCTAYVTTVYWVSVYAEVYTPSSSLYHSSYVFDLVDAKSSYAYSITTQPGAWTGQGRHYWEQEFYTSYCYYNFCTPPFYSGTYTTHLGNTSDQATAYYIVEIVEDHD